LIKLYAHPYSANSRKVHWALEELGLEYDYVLVDLVKGAHKQPEFSEMNPNCRVPVVEDAELRLYESNAILLYLAARDRDDKLSPRSETEAALVNQWLFVQSFDLQPFMHSAFVAKFFASLGKPFDAEGHARALAKLPPALKVLDAHLAGKSFVVGGHFTVADIALAESIGQAEFAACNLTDYPHLRAWFDALAARPAFVKTRPKA
jgi:glutathione S-transferase